MQKEIGVFEANTQLSRLLEHVRKGESITITKHGVPIAKLVPIEEIKFKNVPAVIDELAEIRKRTKRGTESIRKLRGAGRRF